MNNNQFELYPDYMDYSHYQDYKAYLTDLRHRRINNMSPDREVVFIIMDFSGSTDYILNYREKNEFVLREIETLKDVNRMEFTHCILVIYQNAIKIKFFGDLEDFESETVINNLPKKSWGNSPLTCALEVANKIYGDIKEACQHSREGLALPVFLYVTDGISTEEVDEKRQFLNNLATDVQENRKIIIECTYPDVDKSELNQIRWTFGGYVMNMQEPDFQTQFQKCIRALKIASSVTAPNGNLDEAIVKPDRNYQYDDYCRYISVYLAQRMRDAYRQINNW